jgi:site-specific DNA-methyltransferase (adenine-specific)
MAKKPEAKSATETQRRRDAAEKISLARPTGEGRGEGNSGRPQDLRASVTLWQKPSALLDTRVIYCGDNLEQLAKLPDACVDLIYIDPPFNSNRNYEVFWPETSEKRRFDDRHESTTAYIDYMRPRCDQLVRVLKKTGSFYYHCDWHASHYVKVMLDQIFGENNFKNEIVWQRVNAKGNVQRKFGAVHDTLFYYAKSIGDEIWNQIYRPLNPQTVETTYRNVEEGTGRKYSLDNLTAAMQRASKGQIYEWKGKRPPPSRCWVYAKGKMDELEKQGRIVFSRNGYPRYKRYLDENLGEKVTDIWNDIFQMSPKESLGYPTQKPLALLERIIKASSNENDIVLDAFCGCGTAILAAQNLKRQWIGIDISPTSCSVMAKRLRDNTTLREDEDLWKVGRGFVVQNLPFTVELLRKMPPFEFENWAVKQLNGRANKVQIGDKGIDGRIYPVGVTPRETGAGELALEESWYPIQVKQKDKAGRPDIDALETAMRRAARTKGFFVSFDYSEDAEREVTRFWKEEQRTIILLTVKELLDGNFAHKLI